MAGEKKNPKATTRSCAHERKMTFYPDPKIRECIIGEVILSERDLSQSSVVGRILKEYYNSLPAEKVAQLRRVSKNGY
mgnify:CR=1 FL=1